VATSHLMGMIDEYVKTANYYLLCSKIGRHALFMNQPIFFRLENLPAEKAIYIPCGIRGGS
jgi:hypothetical protein